MSIPQPWGGDQLYRPRKDWGSWETSNYWVDPPKRIPAAPTFQKWVPAPETIAFSEAPRDTSRYQALEGRYPQPPFVPPPTVPPAKVIAFDQLPRDMTPYLQPQFSGLYTPLLAPPVPSLPQMQPWANWTLRDYSANQDRFSAFFPTVRAQPQPVTLQVQPYAPWALRDYMPLQDQFSARFGLVAGLFVPSVEAISFGELPRDMTALRLVISENRATYLAPPMVPCGEAFMSFEYEPLDMTPYLLALVNLPPPIHAGAQIPPSSIPFIEWPGWNPLQYQTLQDVFSALATPTKPVYPPGLRPTFTVEALIRGVPRATHDVQVFFTPPPPPSVVPTPGPNVAYVWKDWTLREYPQLNDLFSALQGAQPIVPGFRVMAVTAGFYGVYIYPGDVFDIAKAADFSDSAVNYQSGAPGVGYGWMVKVPSGTPLRSSVIAQVSFTIPDPNRRWGSV